jgi:hypothetical protein
MKRMQSVVGRGRARRPAAVVLTALAASLVLFAAAASPAAAAPRWYVDMHHDPGHLPPGGEGQYRIDVMNIGDTNTSGPVTLELDLPDGITFLNSQTMTTEVVWDCPAAPGASSVTCTFPAEVKRKHFASLLAIRVAIDPSAAGTLTATATVSGGDAANTFTEKETAVVSATPSGFGLVPGSFEADFYEEDGTTPVRQAGAHPYQAMFAFDFNSIPFTSPVPFSYIAAENVRNLTVDLPTGFVGNPNAVGECTPTQLAGGACPRNSQVGRIDLTVYPVALAETQTYHLWPIPVYNMRRPKGVITDLGFSITGNPVHIRAALDPTDYSVETKVSHINEALPVFNQRLTVWGVPADRSHDWERCNSSFFGIELIDRNAPAPCPTDQPRKAFLTVPSYCEDASHRTTIRGVESWSSPGQVEPEERYPESGFQPTGCEAQRFEPRVSVDPVSTAANTPTGLSVNIQVPPNENAAGLDVANTKKVVVTMPRGMTVSPSFADGLTACSREQIGLGTNNPVACPDASRIGAATLDTHILPEPLEGSMYLAEQDDKATSASGAENPFDSNFAVYAVLHDTEERGILVKVPGRLDLDSVTGEVRTTFDRLPQFPFSEFSLQFRSGPRAPLVNPPSCGTQTIGVEITSYAKPGTPLDVSDRYQVDQGPNGTSCPPHLGARPFAPSLEAGTLNPSAGSHSPFHFRLSRVDQDQELRRVDTTLPPGLIARIAGLSKCSEASLASISTAEGSGRRELLAPSCPASSQLGSIHAGMGAGTGPNYFPGKVYLAGPYRGALLSLAIVVPALAGPYDLGTVLVRAPIHVDPRTAQIRVVSDPFPTILHGILLRVRDIRLTVDRPQTTLNPTSCDPMAITAEAVGAGGDVDNPADDTLASLSARFQAANCAALGFRPGLSFRLEGGTKRGSFPALRAVLNTRPGDANIEGTTVTLPKSAFLEQGHIRTICTRVQYAADSCPPASIYGFARAFTPLLDQPLEGPVYLRSSNNKLPDLVAALRGEIDVDVSARIDSLRGRIRSTFNSVPDAPVSKFVLSMQGGKKGLIVNSRNLCAGKNRAQVRLVGHNGKLHRARPLVKVQCGGKARKRGKRARHARG